MGKIKGAGGSNRRQRLRNHHREKQHNRCAICRRRMSKATSGMLSAITLDHIVPLSKGGTHTLGNTQALCTECNLIKGDN